MKLAKYLKLKSLSDEQFGVLINKDRTSVSRYRRGISVPPLDVIELIEAKTKRAVSYPDFLKDASAA